MSLSDGYSDQMLTTYPWGLESSVRSYCRGWPALFSRASGATLHTSDGRTYLDFFAGSGALNYGHNNPLLKAKLLEYLAADGVIHSLDMMTEAKSSFLKTFHQYILQPRGLEYQVQFTGPTGANAVEAALKLARKVTRRPGIVAFTRSFHGMTLGALAASGNIRKRVAMPVGLHDILRMPFDGFGTFGSSSITLLAELVDDPGSGVDLPAAVIAETVQAEGGINVASITWLQSLAGFCQERGVLLIIDDIQAGCGRTGHFFSFEDAAIVPDIVCLSKSLSGYGFPMSVTLHKKEVDVWEPGEHSGTFRGPNNAFVTATAAIQNYWKDKVLQEECFHKANHVSSFLALLAERYVRHGVSFRGRGLIWGIEVPAPGAAREISARAFGKGLLIETAGPRDEVIKLLPPLVIGGPELDRGLEILGEAMREILE